MGGVREAYPLEATLSSTVNTGLYTRSDGYLASALYLGAVRM
jgi:hypothetical protein